MDNQDAASEKSVSTSEEKAKAEPRLQTATHDDVFDEVFDEVFGGPCWTESCPSPRECFHCLGSTTNSTLTAGPNPCPYTHTDAEPVEAESNSPPPIPATRVISPPHTLTLPVRRLSPRLTPVSSPVPPSHYPNSSSHSTSGDLLQVPDTSQRLDSTIASTRLNLSVNFKPATITPTNLSPLPKSPTMFFSVYDHLSDDGNHSSDDTISTLNMLEKELKDLNMETAYSPVPTPPPPSYSIDRLENADEFVRPKIAALEPRHCTCQKQSLGEEIERIPWVHTIHCKITPSRNCYGTIGAPGRIPGSSVNWRTPETMTAQSSSQASASTCTSASTCLRLHAEPNIQLVTHLFAQYSGFRGVRMSLNEDYAYVAYATDAQSRRARLGLEQLLFSQPHRIHVTTVSMEEAIRDIHGFNFPRSSDTFCLCCKRDN